MMPATITGSLNVRRITVLRISLPRAHRQALGQAEPGVRAAAHIVDGTADVGDNNDNNSDVFEQQDGSVNNYSQNIFQDIINSHSIILFAGFPVIPFRYSGMDVLASEKSLKSRKFGGMMCPSEKISFHD